MCCVNEVNSNAVRKGGDKLKAGEVLAGKYRILQALGKGGEGSVWLAVHLQTEQLWAVKEIARKEDGREFHEIDMMKKLRHPSLPLIADVLEREHWIYLVMEYIQGPTLEEVKQKLGRFSPQQVLETGWQLSNVLCYLHGRKIPVFHLDIKPANIIQKKNGTLVLVDFGASLKLFEKEREGRRKGTQGFAAPEQYERNSLLDGRADIYGVGATMYYLISGVRYSGVLQKSKIPGCPENMSGLIRKCIRENPQERYQDSKKLRKEIEKLRKSYQSGRQRIKIWLALLLAIFAAGLAFREIPREFALQTEEHWDYEKLLAEAECTGTEERLDYYRRAFFRAPGRRQAYLQFLEQAGNDGIFSKEEEEQFRSILHTIPLGSSETYEELLAKDPEAYGEVTFRLGMLYWYGYGEEGHRIAAGWFGKCLAALQRLSGNREREEWELRAELFAHMSTYFERLGVEEEGQEETPEVQYWQDLKQILLLEKDRESGGFTELYFLRETLKQIIFLSENLRQAGISAGEMEDMVDRAVGMLHGSAFSDDEGNKERELREEIRKLTETVKKIIEHLRQQETEEEVQGS